MDIDWHPHLETAPEIRIRCADCARWRVRSDGRRGCLGYGDRPDPQLLRHCEKFMVIVKKGRAAA